MTINFDLDFENEFDIDESKMFGEIALPASWLEENVFAPDEMFVCQINLAEIADFEEELLPKEGTLFFFVDMKKKPFKAVIRYFDGEMDDCTSFNDDFEFEENVIDEIGLIADDSIEEAFVSMPLVENNDGMIELLKIVNDEDEPLLPFGKTVTFLIEKDKLMKLDFSKAVLKIEK